MLKVFTTRRTNRKDYILKLILSDLIGIEFQLTHDKSEFINYVGPKLNYSAEAFGDELFIQAHRLLSERAINSFDVETTSYKGLPAIFPVYDKKSLYPFDIFSAAFYFVSRYEEYLPHIKDKYGRFTSESSLANKLGILQKPIVNIWANDLKDKLNEKWPELKFKKKKFKFTPTIDIDAAYAFKNKGIYRTVGGYFKNILNGDWKNIIMRTKVLWKFRKDPFDTFEFIFRFHKSKNIRPIFFILYAEYGENDKNIPRKSPSFQKLIRRMADYGEIGIHPSFMSNKFNNRLITEVEYLSKVIHRDIKKSRQHFLVINMPDTYQNLFNIEIKEDYTMGFADKPGFRAGIACPFNFYDLSAEQTSILKIYPFTVMEGTLKDYQNLTIDQSREVILKLMNEVKNVNGNFITIWHNESLSDKERWVGWRRLYMDIVEEALCIEKSPCFSKDEN